MRRSLQEKSENDCHRSLIGELKSGEEIEKKG